MDAPERKPFIVPAQPDTAPSTRERQGSSLHSPATLGYQRLRIPLSPLAHSYRVGVEVSRVGVDGELVVLRHDGVADLPVRPGAVLGVPVHGAHLSHARP